MRELPKRERRRATVVLCTLLATNSCTLQTKEPMTPVPSSLSTLPATVQPAPPSVAEGPLRLSEVRLVEAAGQRSIRFRLSHAPEGIDYFPLRNPTRLVIDIKGAMESLPKVQTIKLQTH
jgi:hypothetical protein